MIMKQKLLLILIAVLSSITLIIVILNRQDLKDKKCCEKYSQNQEEIPTNYVIQKEILKNLM